MARVNSGLNPKYLSDQHLVAESVEITMIPGSLKVNGYQVKGKIPDHYKLEKGHINFFKNKLLYLSKRLQEVNTEMVIRGFNPGTKINLDEFPSKFVNDWSPTIEESRLVRARIIERLNNPKSGKVGKDYHRHYKAVLGESMEKFCADLWDSELFYV